MITTVLSELTGQLDRRFLLNAFFPMLVFSIGLALVTAAATSGIDAAIEDWDALRALEQTLIVVAAVALIFVCANLLANGTIWLTQIFEGYALPDSLAKRAGRRHQLSRAEKVLNRARQGGRVGAQARDEFQVSFPLSPKKLGVDDFAPTKLGNILRSAETYPTDRYGVDAVRTWPRLYHLLPAEFIASMEAARSSMELLIVVASLAAAFVPAAAVISIAFAGPAIWLWSSLVAGTLIAAIAYRGSQSPAAIYGGHVRAAFDLYRLELLKELGAPRPATPAEEHRTWRTLLKLLEQGEKPPWRYPPVAE